MTTRQTEAFVICEDRRGSSTTNIPLAFTLREEHLFIYLLWTSSAMSLRTGVVHAGSWYQSSMALCRMGM